MRKRTLNTNITSPTLNFTIKLDTYGRQINGEVPKSALIDKEAPKEIINSERKYIIYLLNFFNPIIKIEISTDK